jgi:hypothetical protein
MKYVGDQLRNVLSLIGLSSKDEEAETNERTVSYESPNAYQFKEYVNTPV